jgi:hypothetical protein
MPRQPYPTDLRGCLKSLIYYSMGDWKSRLYRLVLSVVEIQNPHFDKLSDRLRGLIKTIDFLLVHGGGQLLETHSRSFVY